MTRDQVDHYRVILALAAAVFCLLLIQLLPMPPALWTSLSGRGIIVDIDEAANLGSVWRPLSMTPALTWNALYSLFVPLAVLFLAIQLKREERFQLLNVLLVLGLCSGLLGLLQVSGGADGPLYLYRITNNGSAVGLFSNRNHAAVALACLFPMLAVFASVGINSVEQKRVRGWLAVVSGLVLVPLLLVTGSRAGIIVGLAGLVAVLFLYRRPTMDRPAKRKIQKVNMTYVYGGIAVFAMAILTSLFARAQALDRLLASNQPEDLRFQIWGPIAELAWKYFPAGTGFGSFASVYQIDEQDTLLSATYVNHAHNDWLEVYLTGGLIGILLLSVVVVAWVLASFKVWTKTFDGSREMAFARLASTLLFMLGLASLGDYPLRVPSIMCISVLCGVWLRDGIGSGEFSKTLILEKNGSSKDSPLAA